MYAYPANRGRVLSRMKVLAGDGAKFSFRISDKRTHCCDAPNFAAQRFRLAMKLGVFSALIFNSSPRWRLLTVLPDAGRHYEYFQGHLRCKRRSIVNVVITNGSI
jgi:hypothetical protein